MNTTLSVLNNRQNTELKEKEIKREMLSKA